MAKRIWTRRGFLAAVSVAGGFALGRASLYWTGFDDDLRRHFQQRLPELLKKISLPPEVGDVYLYDHPSHADLSRVAHLLVDRLESDGFWPRFTSLPEDEELLDSLALAIRQDFNRPQGICNLYGWHLSQTECHLAAARALAIRDGLIEDVTRPSIGYSPSELFQVEGWGPKSTPREEPFNLQSDGRSAFWFRISGAAPSLTIYLGRREMKTRVHEELVTAALPHEEIISLLRRPGRYEVVAADRERQVQQAIGEFTVLENRAGHDSSSLSEVGSLREMRLQTVLDWGPRSTLKGRAFNVQPSGASAFWIDVKPGRVEDALAVYLGDQPLRTTISAKVITASMPASQALTLLRKPATHPLYLVSRARRARQKVGDFVVEAHPTR